jgi:hypothetical protein
LGIGVDGVTAGGTAITSCPQPAISNYQSLRLYDVANNNSPTPIATNAPPPIMGGGTYDEIGVSGELLAAGDDCEMVFNVILIPSQDEEATGFKAGQAMAAVGYTRSTKSLSQ